MSARYDCADTQQREEGLVAATSAVQAGQLVVLPTDTVYGVGADAFNPAAVTALLAAKGRGRNMPPPVLVGSVRAAAALAESLGAFGQDLIDEFWPGPLTLVFRSSPTLLWDLGDTMGTVAVRMPLHPVALDLLRRTGPMAVSSANRHSLPAATTAEQAQLQLGDEISVYLDALRKVVPVIDLPDAAGGEPELSPADRRAAEAIASAASAVKSSGVKQSAVTESAVKQDDETDEPPAAADRGD